ncbi:hypothetical protein ACPW7J_02265 [Ihubacter sp. rT4E-8]|uniref:hypothetical protein n=1 Tax=Ihubacter sp. rT4E-8 TaxID=3242369 RepID=UPI003CFA75F2
MIGRTNSAGGGGKFEIVNGQEESLISLEDIEKNTFVESVNYVPSTDSFNGTVYSYSFTTITDDIMLGIRNESSSSHYYITATLYKRDFATKNTASKIYNLGVYSGTYTRNIVFVQRMSDDIFVIMCNGIYYTIKVNINAFTISLIESDVSYAGIYPNANIKGAVSLEGNKVLCVDSGQYSAYALKVILLQMNLVNDTVTVSLLDSFTSVNTGSTEVTRQSVKAVGNNVFVLDGDSGYSAMYGTHYKITSDNKIEKIGTRTLISNVTYCALYDESLYKMRDDCFLAVGYNSSIKVSLTNTGFDFKPAESVLVSDLTSGGGSKVALFQIGDIDMFIKAINTSSPYYAYVYIGEVTYEKTELTQRLQLNNANDIQKNIGSSGAYVHIDDRSVYLVTIVNTGSSYNKGMFGQWITHLYDKCIKKAETTVYGILTEQAQKDVLSQKKYKVIALKTNE